MEARYLWAENQEDDEEALASLRRRVLIIEEGGTFFERTREDWKNNKSQGDPAEPPTIRDYREIMYMSRGAKCTVVLVVQSGNARDMGASNGTSAMRDQFAAKVLVRFSANVWQMLVQTRPIPRAPKHKGRGYVAIGDEQDLVQLVNPRADECRAFALEGEPEAPAPTERPVPVPVSLESARGDDDREHVWGTETLAPDPVTARPELQVATRKYDMEEVLKILGTSYDTFRKWRRRAEKRGVELPQPTYIKQRSFYDEDQVDELKSLREEKEGA